MDRRWGVNGVNKGLLNFFESCLLYEHSSNGQQGLKIDGCRVGKVGRH